MPAFFYLETAADLKKSATLTFRAPAKGHYDATNPNDVEILKTRPDKPYIELGTVTVTGFAPSDVAKMHNAIRAKSAPLGADAVILTDEGMVNDPWAGMRRWATGVAIKYKDTNSNGTK